MLSYGKKVTASSELPKYEAGNANDEYIESWWAAASGNPGEWWQVDLGKMMEVKALQVNLADHNFKLLGPDSYFIVIRWNVHRTEQIGNYLLTVLRIRKICLMN